MRCSFIRIHPPAASAQDKAVQDAGFVHLPHSSPWPLTSRIKLCPSCRPLRVKLSKLGGQLWRRVGGQTAYVCVHEITRLKSYQAHLFLHVASLRCRVVCEMTPDLQCRCDQLTRLLLAMLHWRLTVAPYTSNRMSLAVHVLSRMFHRCCWRPKMGLVNVHDVVIEWWPWSEAVIDNMVNVCFICGLGRKHQNQERCCMRYVLHVCVDKLVNRSYSTPTVLHMSLYLIYSTNAMI